MKRIIIQTILLIFLSATITKAQQTNTSQPTSDTIQVKKVFGGYQFSKQGEILNLKKLKQLLATNEQATKEFKSSETSRIFAAILSYTGRFMLGWPLGTAVAGGKPNWAIAGIGAGLTAVSIPFGISSNKRLKKAVHTFNVSTHLTSSLQIKELNFQVTGNGVGFGLKF